MQAVILAGGKGTRLYPLTSEMPKPMVEIFDKPVLEHTIELLKSHDIRDIIITLAYKAEQIIDHFGNGSRWGVDIQYSLEDTPKGTAGGIRRIQPLLDGTFLVISGDALTDFALTSAMEFHKHRSAIATMLLYQVDDPTQFGIVETGRDGKIKRFIEKPKSSEVFTNTINTGIYVLEPEILHYMPYDGVYDFSKDVFPRLLHNDEPFYAYQPEGYWCDVGSLAQYRNVHFDALTGKVKLNLPASRIADGIWIGDGADIHPSVKLQSPLYVGNDATISKHSMLGRFAIIGDNSVVHERAHITHSVLGSGSSIGKSTQVYGSVVGSGFKLADGKNIEDAVVVPDGASSELRAEINSEFMSHTASDEHMFTWSGLEISTFAVEVASRQAIAA